MACNFANYKKENYKDVRAEGKDINKSLQEVSILLGHGKERLELMRKYVLNIK